LLHDTGKTATYLLDETGRIRFNGHEGVSARLTENIFHRLRFSNAETEATIVCVKNHMTFKDVPNMRVSTLKRLLARPTIDDELELHRVDCLGSHGLLDNYHFLLKKREEFSNEPLIPPPLITGRDLLAAGRKAGPLFKKILDAVEALQLEGTLKTKEEALAWVANQPEFQIPLPADQTN
jgi:poly(A) polymerase